MVTSVSSTTVRNPLPVDPALAAAGIAAGRLGLGTAVLLAPRALLRLALREGGPSQEAVLALRMLGVRDVALGLGTLLAARRNPGSVRGWTEAGALADAGDALAIAASPALRGPLRVAGALVAALATGVAILAARRLRR